jgi:hypothetical protein
MRPAVDFLYSEAGANEIRGGSRIQLQNAKRVILDLRGHNIGLALNERERGSDQVALMLENNSIVSELTADNQYRHRPCDP